VPSDDNDDTSAVEKDIPVARVEARPGDEVATRTGRPPGAQLIGLFGPDATDAEIMLVIENFRRDRGEGTPRSDDATGGESTSPTAGQSERT